MTTVHDLMLEVLAADGWSVRLDPELGNVPVHAKGDALLLIRFGTRRSRRTNVRQRVRSFEVFIARRDGSDGPVNVPVLDRFESWRLPSPWFFDEDDYPRIYEDAVLSFHDAAAVMHRFTGAGVS